MSTTQAVGAGEMANVRARTNPLTTRKVRMAPSFFRRRRFIVDWRFQLGLAGVMMSLVGLFGLLVGLALFLPPALEYLAVSENPAMAAQAAERVLYFDAAFWPAVLLGAATVFVMVIRTSHRIAGPLYRMKKVIGEVSAGFVPPQFKLRSGDYLQDEAVCVNRMLAVLREHASDLAEMRHAIQDVRDRLDAREDDPVAKDASKVLAKASEKLTLFMVRS